jgi:hypothetical protein
MSNNLQLINDERNKLQSTLNDEDKRIVENGMYLQKMKPNKKSFDHRYYRVDFRNNELVASSKEFKNKEKRCKAYILHNKSNHMDIFLN